VDCMVFPSCPGWRHWHTSPTHLLGRKIKVVVSHVPKHIPIYMCAAWVPGGWGLGWGRKGGFGE
jgi:hypothetical protein